MNLFSLAWRNLNRHQTRTGLTVFGIAVAAGTLFAILCFDAGYKRAFEEELKATGIGLFVSTVSCPMQAASVLISGSETPRYLDQTHLPRIRQMKGVKAAGGFLMFTAFSPDGSSADLFFGITPEVLKMKPNWRIQGNWFQQPDDIVLGWQVANIRSCNVGDRIKISSIGKEFRVAGILDITMGHDDGFYFLPLDAAQTLFHKEGKITSVGIQLESFDFLRTVKREIEILPDAYVMPAETISQEILSIIGGTKALMYSVVIIALIVSGLGLMNTVLMATFERRTEFGYFRCLGATRSDLIKLILIETFFMCIMGIHIGFALAWGISPELDMWVRQFLVYAPARPILQPDFGTLGLATLAIFILGLLAALYPGWRVSRVSPMEALRND